MLVALITWFRRSDLRAVAHSIETVYPDLETKLLAAYEQELSTPPGRRGFLEEQVIQQARVHALTHERWKQTVPGEQLFAWSSAQLAALMLLVASLFLQMHSGPPSRAALTADGAISETPVAEKLAVEIEPGDVELERGADLLVLARFADRERLPRDVSLATSSTTGEQRFSLQQSLSDPVFAVRVPEVKTDLAYRLSFAGQETREYRVTVFDYPELERADVELKYPTYTGLGPRRIEDVRQLSVIEGTELRLVCRLNKPVTTARLVPSEGEPLELTASPDDKSLYAHTQTMQSSVRWRLELIDDRARKNRQSVEFVVDVVPNRAPEIKLVFPRQDLKVSPLQEVPLEAEVLDDFGIVRWGISYEMTGKQAKNVTLGEKLAAKEKHSGRQLVALEELQAKPDELLAWHAWAEDLGPDGAVRRTTSDIFFCEVSPFEEIFRQNSADGGQPGKPQPPNPTDESLKLQKEIITATWNLRRRETGATPSSAYAADAKTIADSQQKALEKVQEMKEKLESPDAAATVAEIEKQMQAAHRELSAAATNNTLPPLDPALAAEQAAYQGLLKLRARETRITRSKSAAAAAGGGAQSPSGQNLDQLEMKEDEERYETRNKAADAQQTPAQKEREEFLSRLRELARRQEDSNQKIKELQAALDAARNEEERKQIERQLKRLRDEQRDLLRDVDQLKNKLDKPEHNQPLTEASKKLEETRENVRQASDALEKGQTQQALTAGTRAESELDKLRDDFRKQTANQFADEVRDLVDRARKLDERQQQISEQITGGKPTENTKPGESGKSNETAKQAAPTKPRGAGGLRAPTSAPDSKLPEQLGEQKKELAEVLDKAKEITERAEGNEPLLAKQLYDTVRQAHQQQAPRAVEMLQQLVDNGLNAEATKVVPQAGESMKKLREGIEKAAEGVLGGDVESLRRAKREVDRLAQALGDEIARENPAAAPKPGKGQDDGEQNDVKSKEGGAGKEPGKEASKGTANDPNGKPMSGEASQPGKESGGKQPGTGQPAGESKESRPGQPNDKNQPTGVGKEAGKETPNIKESPSKGGQQSGQGKEAGKGQPAGESKDPGKGQQPGDGKQSGDSKQTGESKSTNPGKESGKGEAPSKGQQPGKGPMGQGQQPGQGQPSGQGPQPGGDNPSPQNSPNGQPQPGEVRDSRTANRVGSGPHGVLTGGDWREWSDALRNVEEFVPGTRLRSDAARVREQAQALRAEMKRHSKQPNWDLVRETIYEPLVELQRQLNEELLRRSSPEAAVPLDRDPVPDKFGDAVRRYYERLGSGQ
jgi:hypothetical protein